MWILETEILELATAKGQTRLRACSVEETCLRARHAEREAPVPPVGLFCTKLQKIPVTQNATERGNRHFNYKPSSVKTYKKQIG
jgi:hypothetical protein